MLNPEFNLYERNGLAFCSSRQVAGEFNKQHKNVLQSIDAITDPTNGASEDFTRLNFQPSSYSDSSGKKNREYLMTKDGFAILTMGFTGKKAMRFKEAYINRFNQMESFIRNLAEAKADFPEFTQAIMLTHDEPKHYHFSSELDMINRIVTGMSAKQFKEAHGLGKVNSIRPYLTPGQAEAVKALQRIDIGLIHAIPGFQERKQILTAQYNRRLSIAG
jgi:Rha family phage regulatory protein